MYGDHLHLHVLTPSFPTRRSSDPSHIHINDLNPSIHAFWDAVLNETDRLCAMIKNKRVTMAEWRRQHDVQNDPDADSLDQRVGIGRSEEHTSELQSLMRISYAVF